MASMTMTMPGMASASPMSMNMQGMAMNQNQMHMFFFDSIYTILYSPHWAPTGVASYAGTCIFLIILAICFRLLHTYKAKLDTRWRNRNLNRRYIVVADSDSPIDQISKGATEATTAVLTTNGVDQRVRILENHQTLVQPWRLSVDLPRALLFTVIVGVGYLLMIAVMTMNVGYFLSILAGVFLGDLFMGRYSTPNSHMH